MSSLVLFAKVQSSKNKNLQIMITFRKFKYSRVGFDSKKDGLFIIHDGFRIESQLDLRLSHHASVSN